MSDRQEWVLKQALWNACPISGELSAAPSASSEEEPSVWSASYDGSIIKWQLDTTTAKSTESNTAPGSWSKALLLCGHQAAVMVLTIVEEGAILLSIDETGCARRWSCASGQCMDATQLGFLPSQAVVHLKDGLLAVACRGASTDTFGNSPMALVDCATLEVTALLAPTSIHSLQSFFSNGTPSTDVDRERDMLALSLFSEGRGDLVFGVTRQGFLLVWSVEAYCSTAEVHVNELPTSTSAQPATSVPKLDGELVHASFARGGSHLLLLSNSAWVVAVAEQRGSAVHYSLAVAAGSLDRQLVKAPTWQGCVAASAGQQPDDAVHNQRSTAESACTIRIAKSGMAGFSGRSLYVGGLLLQADSGLSALLWDSDGVGELVPLAMAAGELAIGHSQLVDLRPAAQENLKFNQRSVAAAGDSRVLVASADGRAVAIAQILRDSRGRYHRQWEPWEEGCETPLLNGEAVGVCSQMQGNGSATSGIEKGNNTLASQLGANLEAGKREEGSAGLEIVTVAAAARPGSAVQHLFFQGFSSGMVSVSKLAAASLSCTPPQHGAALSASRSAFPSWQHAAHRGSVTCLLDHACEVFDPMRGQMPLHVLLSGAADGAVHAANLRTGASVFLLHAHTAPVLTLSAPPHSTTYPWRCHVLSCGADGLLCLLSLEHCQCLLRLPGFPSATAPPRCLWCLPKGYIACWLGIAQSGSQALGLQCGFDAACATQHDVYKSQTLLVVWDLHSGQLDRMLRGSAADDFIRDLANFAAEESLGGLNAEPLIRSQSGALQNGVQILEIDVHGLLDVKLQASAVVENENRERLAALQWEGSTLGYPCIALALALLHVWGLDAGVDRQLAAMLEALDLLDAGTTSALSECPHGISGRLQGVLQGPGSVYTLLMPGPPARPDAGLRSNSRNGPGCTWHLGMWGGSPRWVAMRQLALVALAKHLQELSPTAGDGLVACICNACASLTAFYAVRLRERLPRLAHADVGSLMPHFQDPRESLREAARTLLAACSDPITYGQQEPAPFAAFANLIRGSGTMACSHTRRLDAEAWDADSVITASAICMLHPASVPDELLAHAVPGLVSLACVIGRRAMEAASMLTEALQGPAARRWRPFLGDLRALTGHVMAICEQLNSAAAARTSEPGPPRGPPALAKSKSAGRGALHAARAHTNATGNHAQTIGLDTKQAAPVLNRQASNASGTGTAAGQNDQARLVSKPIGQLPGSGEQPNGQEKLAAGSNSLGSRVILKAGEAMQYRNALYLLLPALAALDLIMFLHLLGHRLAGGVPGHSPSHLLLLNTPVHLLHSGQGKALLAAHLPLLMAVVLKGLEPSNTVLRRTCRQGVLALVKEVSMAFPMVDVHASSLQLAVGRAPWGGTGGPGAGAHTAGPTGQAGERGEPIAVYDLHTGRKQRALHFRADGCADVGHPDETVAALAFSSGGGALAAWSPEGGLLRVWFLVAGWSQRFQRTTAVLVPSQAFKFESGQQRPSGMQALDLGWKVCWESEYSISVNHGRHHLGTANLRRD